MEKQLDIPAEGTAETEFLARFPVRQRPFIASVFRNGGRRLRSRTPASLVRAVEEGMERRRQWALCASEAAAYGAILTVIRAHCDEAQAFASLCLRGGLRR